VTHEGQHICIGGPSHSGTLHGFHGTQAYNAESIAQNGLRTTHGDLGGNTEGKRVVYITDSEQVARDYGKTAVQINPHEGDRQYAIVEFDIPSDKAGQIHPNMAGGRQYSHEYFYQGHKIPPEWITKITVYSGSGKRVRILKP